MNRLKKNLDSQKRERKITYLVFAEHTQTPLLEA
jgi:hypothetical protein